MKYSDMVITPSAGNPEAGALRRYVGAFVGLCQGAFQQLFRGINTVVK